MPNCGNCHAPHPTTADIKACFARKYALQDRVTGLAEKSARLVEQARKREIRAFGHSNLKPHLATAATVAKASVHEELVPCEAGPAGISCSQTGIPGTAGLRWNGQRFEMLIDCPRCTTHPGFMTKADIKRNEYHDDRYMAERIMADFA